MNVGYFSINHGSMDGSIFWEKLRKQETITKGEFFNHVRFQKPLLIRMDGKKRMAVISMTI
jgi:hypothetical protein